MPLIYYITKRNPVTAAVEVVVDSNFNQTSLLLSPAVPSTTITAISDTSTNNFSIIPAGDVKPSDFTPYGTNWSNSVFGNTLYISYGSNGAFQFGSGDFTVEAWIYMTAYGGSNIFNIGNAGVGSYSLYETSNGKFQHVRYGDTAGAGVTTNTVPLNTWVHIASVRHNGTAKVYFNGVEDTGATYSMGNITATAAETGRIWANSAYGNNNFYISNLRVVTGAAVYTSNFTPSTAPLTAISGTSLLTCQTNRFVDNSANTFTVTPSGDIKVTTFSPYVTESSTNGSVYFDGNGDYLTIPSPIMLSTTYTVECWIYMTAIPNNGNVANLPRAQAIAVSGVGAYYNNGNDHNWLLFVGASALYFGKNPNFITCSSSLLPVNSWNHIAAVVENNVGKLYVNGVLQGTQPSMPAIGTNSSYTTKIGTSRFGDGSGVDSFFTGHISNFRIVDGTAVYTSNFTPPTAPLTAVSGTSLLTCQDNAPFNNSGFVDTSSSNLPVTRAGNATQGTVSPYISNWSNYFDGSGDYLTIANPPTSLINWWTRSFTIEAWVYVNSFTQNGFSVSPTMAGNMAPTGSLTYWAFGPMINGTVQFYYNYSGFGTGFSTTNPIKLNEWTHIAFVKNGSALSIYINGVESATSTLSVSPQAVSSTGFTIGQSNNVGFNGYISNLRVSSVAQYTGNFTPSTTPLTADNNTTLLTCQSNRFIDNSSSNFTITRTGNVLVSPVTPYSLTTPSTPTSYSGYFDGTGDYLTLTNDAAFKPGVSTNPFSVELWFYATTAISDGRALLGNFRVTSYPSNCSGFDIIWHQVTSSISFRWGSPAYNDAGFAGVVSINTWNHIAVSRDSSGRMSVFVNGNRTFTATTNTSITDSIESSFWIGWAGSLSGTTINPFPGNISNVRMVKGSTPYDPSQATITVPTAPLTAIANTVLLTCQDTTFKDNSSNAFAITSNGDARPTSINPFGTTEGTTTEYSTTLFKGGAYFDGTGDYLQIANNPALVLTNGAWTAECWIYPTGGYSTFRTIFTKRVSGVTTTAYEGFLAQTTGYISYYNGTQYNSAVAPTQNAWNHIAWVHNGTNIRIFLNGVTILNTAAATTEVNQPLVIGGVRGYSQWFSGHIADFRLVKGTAVYTSNFLPPTAPLTVTNNTVLLLDMSSAAVLDATGKNNIETFGSVRLSNSVVKYGSNSLYFNGTSDYLTVQSTPNLRFNGNFTIEAWVYPIARVTTNPCIINNYTTYAINGGVAIYAGHGTSANTTKYTVAFNRSHPIITSTSNINYDSWTHIAVVRVGSIITLYINGVSEGSAANQTAVVNGTQDFWWVGTAGNAVSISYFNGYISDLRITGSARYTTNFDVPTTYLGIQ